MSEAHGINHFKNETILIAPLDWGLGHATRCLELVHRLIPHNTVILGITPTTEPILSAAFPHLRRVKLPSLSFYISARSVFWKSAIRQLFKICITRFREKQWLHTFIKSEPALSVVISDNRYGLYHPALKTVLLTHQLNMQIPAILFLAKWVHKFWSKRFQYLWVPDYADSQKALGGALSHAPAFHPKMCFVGPLSQLKARGLSKTILWDVAVLLSGPEPKRSDWALSLIQGLTTEKTLHTVLLSPTQLPVPTRNVPSNIQILVLPDSKLIAECLSQSKLIIARSGYSTLMDLDRLNKPTCLLVPTPGQWEQEYLASYWAKRGWAKTTTEKNWQKNAGKILKEFGF